jgi:hypothetical protein
LIGLILSCTKKADFKFDKNTAYISTQGISIDEMRVIPWKVGKLGKDTLSRGIRFSFNLPLVKDEDLEILYNKKKVDSWLIKLKRKRGLKNETLGYYSMMLVSPDPRSSNKLRFNSPRKGSIGINYAASSISMRLNDLPCPALNHRLLIDEYGVRKSGGGTQQWVVSGADDLYVPAKVTMISYSPVTVNGGMLLKGEYSIELAFYNQKLKRRLSSFVPLEKIATVDNEIDIAVKGCENYIVPERGSEDRLKKFKFGN